MDTKGINFITGRVPSGQQVVGSYTYYLLLERGREAEHIIMRNKNDDSEIKFYKIPKQNSYATVWADVANVAYSYVYATEL